MTRAADDISLNAFAIHIINDMDVLSRQEVGSFHQSLIDSDRPHIVEVGFCDGGTVNF